MDRAKGNPLVSFTLSEGIAYETIASSLRPR